MGINTFSVLFAKLKTELNNIVNVDENSGKDLRRLWKQKLFNPFPNCQGASSITKQTHLNPL